LYEEEDEDDDDDDDEEEEEEDDDDELEAVVVVVVEAEVELSFSFLLLSALEEVADEDRFADEVDKEAVAEVVFCFLLLLMAVCTRAVAEELVVVVSVAEEVGLGLADGGRLYVLVGLALSPGSGRAYSEAAVLDDLVVDSMIAFFVCSCNNLRRTVSSSSSWDGFALAKKSSMSSNLILMCLIDSLPREIAK
jgi:hypothetical protein